MMLAVKVYVSFNFIFSLKYKNKIQWYLLQKKCYLSYYIMNWFATQRTLSWISRKHFQNRATFSFNSNIILSYCVVILMFTKKNRKNEEIPTQKTHTNTWKLN